MKCPRCDGDMACQTMSFFNTDMICCDCKAVERKHPKYAAAVQADVDAINHGNFNFPGIGLPPELARREKEKV